jgi:hypothetical protein
MALLRQISTTLNNDLSDIDLVALQAATVKRGDGSNVVTGAPAVVAQWARVIDAVAMPLVLMGREVEVMDKYFDTRVSQVKRTKRMLWSTSGSLGSAVVYVLARMLAEAADVTAQLNITGVLLALFIAYIAMVRIWIRMMDEQVEKVAFMYGPNAPVMSMLSRYKATLSDKTIVQIVYVVRAGRTDLLKSMMERVASGSWNGGVAPSCGAKPGDTTYDCTFPIDACTSLDAMPTTQHIVSGYCADALGDMANRLQQIKTGIDTYIRPALWRCIVRGVDVVRDLVEAGRDMRNDGDGTTPSLTRDSVRAFITKEVAPILCIDAAELRTLQYPALPIYPSPFAAGDDGGFSATRTGCWRRAVAHPTAQGALYDEITQTCRLVTDLGGLVRRMPFVGVPDLKGRLLVRRHQDAPAAVMVCGAMTQDALSDATPIPFPGGKKPAEATLDALTNACALDGTCGAATSDGSWKLQPAQSLYEFLSSKPPQATAIPPNSNGDGGVQSTFRIANRNLITSMVGVNACVKSSAGALVAMGDVAAVLRDLSGDMAQALFTLLQRDGFRVSLKANRGLLDTTLANYYGADRYAAPDGIGARITAILAKVDAMVVAEQQRLTRDGPDKYVTTHRLLAKLRALTPDDLDAMQKRLGDLTRCAKDHRDVFPAFRSTAKADIMRRVVVYGVFVLGIGFAVFALGVYTAYVGGEIDTNSLLQRLLLGMCVFVTAVLIVETIGRKSNMRGDHNKERSSDHSQQLLVGASSASRALGELRIVLHTAIAPPAPEKAETLELVSRLRIASANVIEAFRACNDVTAAQPDVPFPSTELILNGLVFLGFLALLAYAASQLGPLERFDNIRQLLDIRAQIQRGDAPATGEIVRVLSCCSPDTAVVTDIAVWFVVIVLLRIGVVGTFQAQDQLELYGASLATEDDCI